MLTYLDEPQIRALLTWDDLIPAMERALTDFSAGRVMQPVRSVLMVEEGKRYLGIMPAVADDVMGLKVVTFYPANEGSSVPTHQAMILLLRTDTGEPVAVMDGRLITEMRTAAVSAAVTNKLASRDAHVLALLGSGVQAKAHLEALGRVRNFDEVRVWSRAPEHADRFAREHGVTATDAETAVRGADVIVTATGAQHPIVRGAWLKPGAHVNAVGSSQASRRELDDEAMGNILLVDSREAAMQEAGDVILSKAQIYAEVGELFAGTRPVPVSQTTIFKSVGIAAEDLAAAKLVLQRAKEGRRSS
jgi:thiomorpholine-carboxylate dehydrogenase